MKIIGYLIVLIASLTTFVTQGAPRASCDTVVSYVSHRMAQAMAERCEDYGVTVRVATLARKYATMMRSDGSMNPEICREDCNFRRSARATPEYMCVTNGIGDNYVSGILQASYFSTESCRNLQ